MTHKHTHRNHQLFVINCPESRLEDSHDFRVRFRSARSCAFRHVESARIDSGHFDQALAGVFHDKNSF